MDQNGSWEKQEKAFLELIEEGSFAKIKAFLKDKDEAFFKSLSNNTLFKIIEKKNHHVLGILILNGVNLKQKDESGKTPLIYSVVHENLDISKLLLQSENNINEGDSSGKTVLHYSVETSNTFFVNLFLKEGANIEKRTILGDTPLLHAFKNAGKDIIQTLVDAGADLSAMNHQGESALDIIKKRGDKAIENFFLQIDSKRNVDFDDRKEITNQEILISQNHIPLAYKNVDERASAGMTPLMIESEKGNIQAVESLLRLGAKIDLKDFKGKTALIYAILKKDEAIIDLLLKAGPDLELKDKDGKTVLYYAVISGKLKIIEKLVNAGGNFKVRFKGLTLLMVAAQYGYKDICEYLIHKGLKIQDIDFNGHNAAFYARSKGFNDLEVFFKDKQKSSDAVIK